MAGFDERFEVGCEFCGVLCHKSTLQAALLVAQARRNRHSERGCDLYVYDRMARYGNPQLRRWNGEILEYKPSV